MKNEKKSSSSINNNIFSSLLLLVSISIAILIGEGFLRLKNLDMKNYDIEMWKYSKQLKRPSENIILGHEHIKNSKAKLQSVEIKINNYGLRDSEINQLTKLNRIIFLGSSITLGWGVEEEKTLTARLESMLNKEKIKYEVINGSVGNYNTVRYVELFTNNLSSLKPDSIVVQYFVNDAEILPQGGGNWLLRNSQLAVTLMIAFNRILHPGDENSLLRHYQKIYEQDSEGYEEMKKSLEKISQYAHRNKIKIFLVMTPDVHNLIDYPFGFIHEKMKNLSSDLDIEFLDLLPYFEGIPQEEIWAMPGDPHPNSIGHEIMAKAIFENLNF